jgi:hypothetical protein
MDSEQNVVNQLWQEYSNANAAMQILYKLQEIAYNQNDSDFAITLDT